MSTEYKFKVEMKEAGQRRKYGDSYYHYIVESKGDLQKLELFCKKVLCPAIPEDQYKKEEGVCFGNHFRDYFTDYTVLEAAKFLSEESNKVEYKVVSPSTH